MKMRHIHLVAIESFLICLLVFVVLIGLVPFRFTGEYAIGNYTIRFVEKCGISNVGGCSGYTFENGEIFIVTNKGLLSQYDTCRHEKLHNILTYEHNVTVFDDGTFSYDNDYEELLIRNMTMILEYDEDCVELFKKAFERG